jgi:hypothetical protein
MMDFPSHVAIQANVCTVLHIVGQWSLLAIVLLLEVALSLLL